MSFGGFTRVTGVVAACALLAGCGDSGMFGDSGLFNRKSKTTTAEESIDGVAPAPTQVPDEFKTKKEKGESTIWDLFANTDDPNTTLEVNKYIWRASLEVLNFLPIESVDPFSGVITTGYGTPPGGGRAYRAVIYVQDPALDARSLKLALATRSGPVSPETVRSVEDAILTRARQLRIADKDK